MARDDGKQQAMSATRVSVIQARLEAFREALEHRSQLTISISDYTIDVDALLAEVERRRAREAALVAFAEMVGSNAGVSSYLREQARALLASAGSEGSGGDGL